VKAQFPAAPALVRVALTVYPLPLLPPPSSFPITSSNPHSRRFVPSKEGAYSSHINPRSSSKHHHNERGVPSLERHQLPLRRRQAHAQAGRARLILLTGSSTHVRDPRFLKLNGVIVYSYVAVNQRWHPKRRRAVSGGPWTPGQVLVRVRAAGVNPVDYKLPNFIAGPVAGLDMAGVVEAVGSSDVMGFSTGDEVLGFAASGAVADWAVADASKICRKPAGLGQGLTLVHFRLNLSALCRIGGTFKG
jgi:hypothetical protein